MLMKIKKAVIPAAGYGTRFLPATKASPKEMLPIVDKPVIQYVVEEAVASGIEEIIIITGSNKRAIEDHFDYNFELEYRLKQSGKEEQYNEIRAISDMAKFIYVRQKEQLGNGHAILCAEEIIGDEPFAVLWGDEFIHAAPPRLKQMVEVFEKFGGPVISAVRIEDKESLNKYGIAKIEDVEDNIYKIKGIVEKPGPDEAPSNLATHGAYILTPEIFSTLKNLTPGKGGEIWLTDAINVMAKDKDIYACEIKNSAYYDCGNKLEYLKANINFALQREDLGPGLRAYLEQILAGSDGKKPSVDNLTHDKQVPAA